ncbi:MAG: methyltransferase domain-containing protein [Deltaproteobacteria bacterium]|nr:methyltransferase domain-containing protein [Deltaproteobacteria bacterium]
MAKHRGPDRRFFDLWSLSYDAPLVQRLTYRPEQDAVLRALPPGKPRVLDVGCGTGLLAERIYRRASGDRVVGCDFSPGMLRRAAQRRSGPEWVRADAQSLPFADGSFEAVVSTQALHWVPDQRAALAEFLRVLVPGGRLLVSLINPPLEVMSRITRVGSRILGEPLYWPTRERMRRQVEAVGFHIDSQKRIFRLPAAWTMPSVLTQATRPLSVGSRGRQPFVAPLDA